jgi:mannose/fructose/N-acetylgalactosamine-specific phosphotransferase system component IID
MTRPQIFRVFLRLFTVQGSWNYRTMTGNGFAFALLPVLRNLHAPDHVSLDAAVDRHVGHFNAHPYLTGLAVGAVARMEEEGEEADRIEHFKTAVRGPLGGLGDQLIWARWLPATALLGIGFGLVLSSVTVGIVLFLLLFNVGHLVLRIWAFRTGLAAGAGVAPRLRQADLGGWILRVGPVLAIASGLALGALALPVARASDFLWVVPASAAFWCGARWGTPVWKPAMFVLCVAVVAVCMFGRLA